MEEAEVVKARVTESEKSLHQEETIVKSDWAAQDQRVQGIRDEIASLAQNRAEMAAQVDP
jgi:hypothetical protein